MSLLIPGMFCRIFVAISNEAPFITFSELFWPPRSDCRLSIRILSIFLADLISSGLGYTKLIFYQKNIQYIMIRLHQIPAIFANESPSFLAFKIFSLSNAGNWFLAGIVKKNWYNWKIYKIVLKLFIFRSQSFYNL